MASVATFNPVLTGVLVKQFVANAGGLVWPVLAPVFNTVLQSAKYPVWPVSNDVNVPILKPRSYGDGYHRASFDLSDDSYSCTNRGLEVPIDDDFRAVYQNQLDADMAAVGKINNTVTINQELRTKAAIDAAVAASLITVATTPSVKWNATSGTPTPVKDVKAAKNAFAKRNGAEPTHIIIPRAVAEALEEDSDVLERIKYTGAVDAANIGNGTLQRILAEVLGIQNVVIAGKLRNTATEGQAISLDYIWGKDVYLSYSQPGNDLSLPNAMRTFVLNGQSPETTMGVFTYRDETHSSDIHRGKVFTDEKITGARFLTKIPGCIS